VPPDFVAVKKSDDWSSVDDMYEDERKQWLKDNPEPDAPTMGKKDSWQTRLPNFDPSMDDPIWGPSVAMRVIGDYTPGSPVRQGAANLGYEDLVGHGEFDTSGNEWKEIAGHRTKLPADDDPTWDPDVESEWERDPETGFRYRYGRDRRKRDKKVFLDLEEGMKGSWLARPTKKDGSNLYSHTGDPRKLVFVRRNALLGKPMRRDSDQNPEGVAEMFLQHDKNLPKEGLATVPLRGRSYQHAAVSAGVPDHVPNIPSMKIGDEWDDLTAEDYESGVGAQLSDSPYWNPSRWSDALLPWEKPEKEKEDWHKVMQGEPMDIAFQLLKFGLVDDDETDPTDPTRQQYFIDADEQLWGDEADADLRERTTDMMHYLQDMSPEEKLKVVEAQGEPMLNSVLEGELGACKRGICDHKQGDTLHEKNIKDVDQFLLEAMMHSWMPDAGNSMSGLEYEPTPNTPITSHWTADDGFRAHAVDPSQWRKLASEPMDIAFQLLKERKYHPGHTSEIGMDGDSSLIDEAQRRENAYREAYIDGEYNPGEFGPWWQGPPQTTETLGTQDEDSQFTRNKIPVDSAAIVRRLMGKELPIRVQQARIQDDEGPSFLGMPFNEKTGFTKSLLKDRKSPEAWANKKRYDTQYEKNPMRVKYREQLNTERRKRGIYGKGGSDVSHTQGGKLTLENPSSNRARHFKGKGTLRRVKVK